MSKIKLQIKSTKAAMTPPVGPILGQYGIPGMKFCQEFNNETKIYKKETLIKVRLLQNKDKSIQKLVQSPSIKYLLKRCISKQKTVSIKRIYQLALILTHKINTNDETLNIKNICKTLISTVHSMHCIITR